MANLVRRVAAGLLNRIGSQAHVLAVRTWEPDTMYEVDIYLPKLDLAKWTTVPRLKCRVAEFEFRDYTPATWDVRRKTCTLYIETGHSGPGSQWVQQLRTGDTFLFDHAQADKLPASPGPVLALGDGSALGHLLALQQLLSLQQNPLDACVAFHDDYQIPATLRDGNAAFALLPTAEVQETLAHWLHQRPLGQYTSIYLAGNMGLVATLRRQLKARPEVKARFYVTGFWK